MGSGDRAIKGCLVLVTMNERGPVGMEGCPQGWSGSWPGSGEQEHLPLRKTLLETCSNCRRPRPTPRQSDPVLRGAPKLPPYCSEQTDCFLTSCEVDEWPWAPAWPAQPQDGLSDQDGEPRATRRRSSVAPESPSGCVGFWPREDNSQASWQTSKLREQGRLVPRRAGPWWPLGSLSRMPRAESCLSSWPSPRLGVTSS